jgi:hypothetical protein
MAPIHPPAFTLEFEAADSNPRQEVTSNLAGDVAVLDYWKQRAKNAPPECSEAEATVEAFDNVPESRTDFDEENATTSLARDDGVRAFWNANQSYGQGRPGHHVGHAQGSVGGVSLTPNRGMPTQEERASVERLMLPPSRRYPPPEQKACMPVRPISAYSRSGCTPAGALVVVHSTHK